MKWLLYVADLAYLVVLGGSVVGALITLIHLATAWRQGWVLW